VAEATETGAGGTGMSDSESSAADQIAPASDEPRRHADPQAQELCRCAGSAGARALPRARELHCRVGSGGASVCFNRGPPWVRSESFGGCWRWSRSERRRLIVEPSPPHLADTSATTCALQVPTPPLIWSTPPQPLTCKFQWERREGGGAGERGGEVRWKK
jgi:hypothetical protein